MISAGDFRNGVTFEMDGQVMQVVEFQHVKPGKGAAFVRTKMKNVITGAVVETSFNPTAKFEEATIERKTMEYSYADGNLYYFMDPESYELIPIGREPARRQLQVRHREYALRHHELQGQGLCRRAAQLRRADRHPDRPRLRRQHRHQRTKPATVETGATVKVPLFINEGDRIKIDTRSGEYLERAKG